MAKATKRAGVKQMEKDKKANAATSLRIGIDFGCGQNKVSPEYFTNNMQVRVDKVVGVDIANVDGVDHVHDLTKFPYKFLKDNSADAIFTSHFFEHLDGPQRALFMDECYRILKPGGRLRHIHPDGRSDRFYQDFTHKFPNLVENSYYYFNRSWRQANKLTHGAYDLKCNFVGLHPDTAFTVNWTAQPDFGNKTSERQMFELRHYRNAVEDMTVDLIASKP